MNLAEIADLAAIAQAGHDEAERLLAVLERRRVEPQVMAVALMFAAGTLIGRLAPDAEALQTMIRHSCAILEHHALNYFCQLQQQRRGDQ